jgi:hypothetical protein
MGLFTSGKKHSVAALFEEKDAEATEEDQEETEEQEEQEEENESTMVHISSGGSSIDFEGLSKSAALILLESIKNCTTKFFEYADADDVKYLINVERISSVQMTEE